MQNSQLTEAYVKKQLGISDWRHMSKDKIIQFVSYLDRMDPEVAKKAIEQFPDFSRMLTDALKDYKSATESAIKANTDLNAQFIDLCNRAIDTIKAVMGDGDNITWEQKKYCMDMIKGMVDKAADMTSESRDNNSQNLWLYVVSGIVAFVFAAAMLGVNSSFFKPGKS